MIQHNDYMPKKDFRLFLVLFVIVFFSLAGVISAHEDVGTDNSYIGGITFSYEDKESKTASDVSTVDLTKDEIFEKFVRDEISYEKDNFMGPGLEMVSDEIEVFNLIQNSDIFDPEYLEREKGIIINVKYEGGKMNRLQKTLWSYEYDATVIYRIFFTSEYQKKIGFLIVSFEDQDYLIENVKFKMTAADAEKYKIGATKGLYLDSTSWSSVSVYPDGQISMYEDPESKIVPENMVRVNYGSSVQNMMSDEKFKEYVIEKNNSLNLLSQKIIIACAEEDWGHASDLSEDLMALSDSVKNDLGKIILSEGGLDLKENYLKILNEYHNAAMYMWYGTTFLDESKIKDGVFRLKEGINLTNNVYVSIDVEPVVEYDVIGYSAAEIIPDTLKLTEVYKYQDSAGENDISLRIEDYGYKNSFWTKEGDKYQQISSEYSKKYLYIVVDVTHLGFRGGDTEYIFTPDKSDFTLYYQGEEIGDSTPLQYIRSLGTPYDKVKLNRREHFESVMLFSVPDDFNEKEAYVSVDLGGDSLPSWSFDYPENSSINLQKEL